MKNLIVSFRKRAREQFKQFRDSLRTSAFSRATDRIARESWSAVRERIGRATSSFSLLEAKIFIALLIVLAISFLGILLQINDFFMVEVPASGGSLREGVIGAPRFINPLLALSDADRDLTALIYSGLLRPTPGGELLPDLAESYSISDDGLTYTFRIKEGLAWQDGKQITSNDVVFTIMKIQDPVLRSLKRASWEGVTVEKQDDRTVTFTLKQPYSPFLENATLGIIPEHIWNQVGSEQFGFSKYNIEPIGSGPYKIQAIKKDSLGIPERYSLVPFKQFSLGKAYIDRLEIYFFSNEEKLLSAFSSGQIEAINAIPPQKASELKKQGKDIKTYILPRVFGVFFNQNQNKIFTNHAVRSALNMALPREEIVQKILYGFGTAIEGPLPPGALGFLNKAEGSSKTEEGGTPQNIAKAQDMLEVGGWKINKETGIRERTVKKEKSVLEFTLVTSDVDELKRAALFIADTWKQLGVQVTIKTFGSNDLNQNTIRPRKYDALFFGEIVGRESDPFAFWHSSQRNDPGLNIAQYANITIDNLLDRARQTLDRDKRAKIYEDFQTEIKKDVPAVFVYTPDFLYILPKKIRGIQTGTIATPSERFADVANWFIETERVWRLFAHNK